MLTWNKRIDRVRLMFKISVKNGAEPARSCLKVRSASLSHEELKVTLGNHLNLQLTLASDFKILLRKMAPTLDLHKTCLEIEFWAKTSIFLHDSAGRIQIRGAFSQMVLRFGSYSQFSSQNSFIFATNPNLWKQQFKFQWNFDFISSPSAAKNQQADFHVHF